MKKYCVILISITAYAMEQSPFDGLRTLPYNQVAYVAAHNGFVNTHRPSAVANQDLTLVELMWRGVRATKVPVHFQEDRGQGNGTGTVAAHGLYRGPLFNDYYPGVSQFVDTLNTKLKNRTIFLKLFGWIQVPGVYTKLRDIPALIDSYNQGVHPVFDIVQNAQPVAYGTGSQPAHIPFHPASIDPNARPFVEVLSDIKKFLDDNLEEIFTLFIEKKAHTKDIVEDFRRIGLDAYALPQDPNALWPTIHEMIARKKRLVVFITDAFDARYPWILSEDDFVWRTDYAFSTKEALAHNTTLPEANNNFQNRFHNKLFQLPHFLTIGFAGLPGAADVVNQKKILRHRVRTLARKAGVIPNFVETDFTEHPNGDVFQVVQELNYTYQRDPEKMVGNRGKEEEN